MGKHTEGQWYVGTYDHATAKIWSQSGKVQVADSVSLEDAAYIVRAVNAHADLVAALEDSVRYMKLYISDNKGSLGEGVALTHLQAAQSALAMAKA